MALPTTSSANPGNLVVPLSAIIDQLQGKLSAADLNALLLAVVSKRKAEVRPGDLITADLVNQILADLQDLNARVTLGIGGGTVADGTAVATFHDACNAFGSVVKQGRFLPTGTSAEAIKSAIQITAYLQDVMYTALAGGVLAYMGGAASLLEAARRLYDRQHEIVVLFLAPIPGVSDTTEHRRFGTALNVILEQDNALGAVSYKKALDTSDLAGALAAQNRITGMVRSEGGDVVTGNLEVTYLGSLRGETLVIGDTQPFLYKFRVANKTNRELDVQLKAEFLPPRASWTERVSVVGLDGAARSHIPLAAFMPANPTDPRATQEIRVAVMTPAGAANGDKGTLQLTASVPEPINRRGFDARELTVGTVEAPAASAVVSFTAGSPVISGALNNAAEVEPISFAFNTSYSAPQGPSTRTFRLRMDVTAPANPDPLFDVQFVPADAGLDAAASTATRKVSLPFQMSDGARRDLTVFVTPLPGSKDSDLTFSVIVESTTDNIATPSRSFTISVKRGV